MAGREMLYELFDNITATLYNKPNEEEIKEIIELLDKWPQLQVIKDSAGMNIGMIAAHANVEPVTLKTLDNKDASVQQDNSGWNIGMHAASFEMEEATNKALQNEEAAKQKSSANETIESIAKEKGLIKEQTPRTK